MIDEKVFEVRTRMQASESFLVFGISVADNQNNKYLSLNKPLPRQKKSFDIFFTRFRTLRFILNLSVRSKTSTFGGDQIYCLIAIE